MAAVRAVARRGLQQLFAKLSNAEQRLFEPRTHVTNPATAAGETGGQERKLKC
jgi:hypothetical protein